ncbi:hypothetical protein CENSYa_0681 [Cenarchaeum symbiosum A]|uniref:Uncharacterized protein n=1 Tax=Cenarchaeum symbiosum (strain A) TaxID=414004 RepID=A0RVE7_CENSY|nr:hypothetical protein CENSYa_0681 [Cenarchaeum symbiosum A]
MVTDEKRREILAEIDEFVPIIDKSVEEAISVMAKLNEGGQKLDKIQTDLQKPVEKICEIMDNVDSKDPKNAAIRERILTIMTRIGRIKKYADELDQPAI